MKEVVYIEDIKELEYVYLSKQTQFLLEDTILYTFNKQELDTLINITKQSYLKEYLPYKHRISKTLHGKDIDELSIYYIEQFYCYFLGGQELDKVKGFLNKLERFYKLNHTNYLKNSTRKQLDISTISVREILSMYIKPGNLRRNIRCTFPKHKDNTSSLRVYENTNSFYCYGCHRGGNIINLISEMEGITTKEAYKKLIKLYT